MFDSLSGKLQNVFDRLKGRGRLTDGQVEAALREIRLALLEADVSVKVVKGLMSAIKKRAVGSEVMESLTPGQQVVKIVHEELTAMMGGTAARMELSGRTPSVVMMLGLQGTGKTTSAAKLALRLKKEGRRPMLAAADVQRPAAVQQLISLGAEIAVPVFSSVGAGAVEVAAASLDKARQEGSDVLIIDTAGRLHVDEPLMDELAAMRDAVRPQKMLLVLDSLTGQDAVNSAVSFSERLDFDGIVLTKLDGDARGGAALSVRAVTGKPVYFAGTSERMDGLDVFHPERLASRILGMGDVLGLIEKAQENVDSEKARELEARVLKAEFDLEDLLTQMKQLRQLGPVSQIMEMLPGLPGMGKMKDLTLSGRELDHAEAIVLSMTREERKRPQVIDGSRRRRIAAGSGRSVQEVNALLKQFTEMKRLMKRMGGKNAPKLPFGM